MRYQLLAFALTISLLFFSTIQPLWATDSFTKSQENTHYELELPSSLADDDSFEELPFEQLRQALREEVERNPKKSTKRYSSKRYNLLIR